MALIYRVEDASKEEWGTRCSSRKPNLSMKDRVGCTYL